MQNPVSPGRVLTLKPRDEGNCRVLAATGQLTEKECGEFVHILEKELGAGTQRLVLDLDGLMYMSSAGLGALVAAHKKFGDNGARLILAGTNPKVRKLLALTSLDKLIESVDSVKDALALS